MMRSEPRGREIEVCGHRDSQRGSRIYREGLTDRHAERDLKDNVETIPLKLHTEGVW